MHKSSSSSGSAHGQSAYTLLELLVMIAIFAILIGLLVLVLAGRNGNTGKDAVKAKYESVKNEIEKNCKVEFNRVDDGSDDGSDDGKPRIHLDVTNNSLHEIVDLELGLALYANGACVYKTGYLETVFLPCWSYPFPARKSTAIHLRIAANSDDHFKLKTAGPMVLRVMRVNVRAALVNGKRIDFQNWIVQEPDSQRG
jgi:competence protein ComGC